MTTEIQDLMSVYLGSGFLELGIKFALSILFAFTLVILFFVIPISFFLLLWNVNFDFIKNSKFYNLETNSRLNFIIIILIIIEKAIKGLVSYFISKLIFYKIYEIAINSLNYSINQAVIVLIVLNLVSLILVIINNEEWRKKMIKKYKEKCEVCGNYSNNYFTTLNGHILCSSCHEKTNGKIELEHPTQLSIDQFIYQEENENGK